MNRGALAGLLLLLSACGGPSYTLEPPAAFKRYTEGDAFRFVTADGVMLKAREVENYPPADLPFWTDALQRHLEARGYTFRERNCFETKQGLDGCTLDFLLPYGAEDWVLSETLFVVGDRVVLLESAGPFERYQPIEQALKASLRTFDPGD